MKSGDKIICFGDSITKLYSTELRTRLHKKSFDLDVSQINAGVGGDTTRNGLKRLPELLDEKPDYIIVSFGMNDQLQIPEKNVPIEEFRANLKNMVDRFIKIHSRVILLTIIPVQDRETNKRIELYNNAIYDIWRESKVRLVDINAHWKFFFKNVSDGSEDGIHPNGRGIDLICEYALRMLSRHSYILLWMYNGNPCACNYRCPYCQYDSQRGHHFQGSIEAWRAAFKKNFRDQHLVFYFAHGEPTIGKKFYDILEMIGKEPNWEGRMTSNLSTDLERFVQTKVVKEGRFHVNGSFHPHMTTREQFLKKLLFLREHGIETPVVYVMYPPLFERFGEDFAFFTNHGFLVHVRRFTGRYNSKNYPEAYSDKELQYIARYCDDQTIRSMLFNEPSYGRVTWTGIDFFAVDNIGNVGYCDDFRPDARSLGNLFEGTFFLKAEPEPFPARYSSDGTVDGVANFVDTGYDQLSGNNIIDFSKKGGVHVGQDCICYKHFNTDFNDSKIRASYHFPARNFNDVIEILKNPYDAFGMKIRRLKYSLNREIFNYSTDYSLIRYFTHHRQIRGR